MGKLQIWCTSVYDWVFVLIRGSEPTLALMRERPGFRWSFHRLRTFRWERLQSKIISIMETTSSPGTRQKR
jgi:hypothetical protein